MPSYELTHASFFSGVGGLDLGLERAGWRTVSFSEIDPYANAVLAERWPSVPNLGDITDLARSEHDGTEDQWAATGREPDRPYSYRDATLWSGGFPCQDLSVAGKRAGFGGVQRDQRAGDGQRDTDDDRRSAEHDAAGGSGAGDYATRSSLAFAFLALVERHRPPAVLLENVPGLLSSHRGRDMAALVGLLAELRYGWAYRVLDARHFGVPQRRRRVFIVALDLERGLTAERAAEVLSVGTRCARHPATGHAAGEGAAAGTGDGTYLPQSINAKWSKGYSGPAGDEHHNLTLGPPSDPGGNGKTHGLARGLDYRPQLEGAEVDEVLRRVWPTASEEAVQRAAGGLRGVQPEEVLRHALHGEELRRAAHTQGGQRSTDLNTPLVYTKSRRAQTNTDDETWVDGDVMPTINAFDVGDTRTTAAILSSPVGSGSSVSARPRDATEDDLLPLGLDSHRYRTCGNGVVSSVSEYIGHRLIEVLSSDGLLAESVR